MFEYIYILRVIGTVLITNSHFGSLYPLSSFAVGGSLGNVIFFLVSGFTLSVKELGFARWYLYRLKKIYPSLWLICGVLILIGWQKVDNIYAFIKVFIYPTIYWFISAIIVFYIIFYFILKYYTTIKGLIEICATIVSMYIIVYLFVLDTTKWIVEGESLFKWIFYFGVMCFGLLIKKSLNFILELNINSIVYFLSATVSLVLHLLCRIMTIQFEWYIKWQWTVQFFSLLFGVFLFFGLATIEPQFNKLHKNIKSILHLVSASTLEIYLLFMFAGFIGSKFRFPINVIFALFSVLLLGLIVHRGTVIIELKIEDLLDFLFSKKRKGR